MTTAAPDSASAPTKKTIGSPASGAKTTNPTPDDYRMTIGEHLEELRTRLILGLMGFAIAAVVCFVFGEKVVRYFLLPLMDALKTDGFSPQVFMSEVSESFMVYVKISMITAGVFASPWLVYQLWLFIAAGLYEHERKYITKYLPLSIGLLISGMVFLYFVVLPLMLRFFVAFNLGVPVSFPTQVATELPADFRPILPILHGDPAKLEPGLFWYDAAQGRLKFVIAGASKPEIRVISYGSTSIVSPHITLEAYIDMVVGMLLSFGLAFQTPLIVLALVRIGIFEVDQLKAMRRYVYFGISIIAGVIVPDVVGGMIALMVPLMFLFELGLWMAREPGKGTGFWTWVTARYRSTREQIRLRGMGAASDKLLTWGGTILLIALIIHVMTRDRGVEKGSLEPAGGPGVTTQPSTRAIEPTSQGTPPATTAAQPATAAAQPATATLATTQAAVPMTVPATLPAASPATQPFRRP